MVALEDAAAGEGDMDVGGPPSPFPPSLSPRTPTPVGAVVNDANTTSGGEGGFKPMRWWLDRRSEEGQAPSYEVYGVREGIKLGSSMYCSLLGRMQINSEMFKQERRECVRKLVDHRIDQQRLASLGGKKSRRYNLGNRQGSQGRLEDDATLDLRRKHSRA